jgi:para-aminobenzoate synthetase component 1
VQLSIEQLNFLRQQLAAEARQHEVCLLLDNHASLNACGLGSLELAFAAGVKQELSAPAGKAFDVLTAFIDQQKDQYVFGFLTYDLKNELERLHSNHPNGIGFPALYFFVPQQLLLINNHNQVIAGVEWVKELLERTEPTASAHPVTPVQLTARVEKTDYLRNVETIRRHIIDGDVYELNYCVEFYAEQAQIDPYEIYQRLSQRSPVPFGGLVKLRDKFLLCASPERFMKLKEGKLYSQPIKGTARRGNTKEEDEQLKLSLLHSEKERAENLMIVDLVRNDLARSAQTGTVKVEELFGIYTFPQVHQMISTVSAKKRTDIHPVESIKNAFPMGSMTGAPKIRSMELIEDYEQTQRGLYSGSIGYFAPGGNFDFNVVIRSIQYNTDSQYLSFEVGGAITYDSDPESEYAECLLKAKAMIEVLCQ